MRKCTESRWTFSSKDGTEIHVYKWASLKENPKGIVQIAHGMAETASRYKRLAKVLTEKGFIVYANDHRGHGQTAKDLENLGYLGDQNGFALLVEDMGTLTKYIRAEHPGVPVYMFAHSMGSFAAQRYILDRQGEIDGLVLSGSNGAQGMVLRLGQSVAKLEMKLKGSKAKATWMNRLTFGAYNRRFSPKKTGFEWLTRDTEEIQNYMDDPYCGSVFTTSFYDEFLQTLRYIEDKKNQTKIPTELPIFILSGDEDPVGNFGKGTTKLYETYHAYGVKEVELKLYKGARHELLNELNKEEVTTDLIHWLEKQATQKEQSKV